MKRIILSKQNKGYTLVELVVALVIGSIILAALASMFLFSLRMFNKSDNLSRVQSDVRMASDYLTSELRNVKAISLSEDPSLTQSLDISALSAKYSLVKSVSFEIKTQGSNFLLTYTVGGSDVNSENPYSLATDVLLNNITSAVSGTNTSIYYEK